MNTHKWIFAGAVTDSDAFYVSCVDLVSNYKNWSPSNDLKIEVTDSSYNGLNSLSL